MKRVFLLGMATTAMMLTLLGCSDRPVEPAQVPAEIQTFVQQYFPGQTIAYAEKDLEWFTYKYDVVLSDGTELNFDTDNEWDKIDTKMTPVPAVLVPAPVATYVNTNFPSVAITKVDKDFSGYDVELANGLELKFSKQGVLTEMGD